jgi:hypothetical protein
MVHSLIPQGVFDEAGDTGIGVKASRYLIIAGVVCEDIAALRRIIVHARKSIGKKARQLPEIKARDLARDMPRLIPRLLSKLMTLDIAIYAVILDKRSITKADDPEGWYRTLYAACVNKVLQDYTTLQAVIDRRYTKNALNSYLVYTIAQAQPTGTTLTIVVQDSQLEPALQVVDVVAWTLFRKYEHQLQDLYEVIAPCIVEEAVLTL